jgi:hypothetical protein
MVLVIISVFVFIDKKTKTARLRYVKTEDYTKLMEKYKEAGLIRVAPPPRAPRTRDNCDCKVCNGHVGGSAQTPKCAKVSSVTIRIPSINS